MLALLLATFAVAGCGNGKDKVVTVTGKATHNGNPVPGVIVSFVPQGENEVGPSTGLTNESGEFTLTVFKTKERGAVVGSHKVCVSLPLKPDEDKEQRKNAAKNPYAGLSPDVVEVLRKYGRQETTPLTVEVTGDTLDLKLD
jgi:hypothetical protein